MGLGCRETTSSSSSTLVHHHRWFVGLVLMLITVSKAQSVADQRAFNNSISAIFVFGDSTVDPGNNNYVATPFKCNFLPYGRDFPNGNPTGRFTNGRLTNDFIANYVGVKEYVPPYLDPSLSMEELMTGVSFASAGSGFDPLTPTISNVIALSKQLEYFMEYQKGLEVLMGKEKTQNLIGNALYLVSAGTNDFVVNYFSIPIRRKSYNLPTYMDFLSQQVHQFMQGLLEQGARRIAVAGLPPMGCLPIVITLNSDNPIQQRSCVDFYSSIARTQNSMLEKDLNDLQLSFASSGARIVYMDVYGPLWDMTQTRKYDFDEVSSGCCGTGLLEASLLCNPKSFVCSNASKYVFWDSIHPTEMAYYNIFQAIRPRIDFLIKD